MVEQTFGSRLAWLREVSGLGSRELGALAGLSVSYASVVEPSSVARPSFKTASNIAKVFGVDAEWLVDGVGDEPSTDDVVSAVTAAREALKSTGTDGE